MRGIYGKTALVTGAAGGIGSAVVRRLHQAGAKVAITDIEGNAAKSLASEFEPAKVRAWTLDVASAEEVETVFDDVESALGPIDILVHAGAVYAARPLLAASEADFRRMLDINVMGAFHCLRAAGKRMSLRHSGSIVTVASQSAAVVRLDQAEYGASKSASTYLTKALGLELAPVGVRCNVVHPGVTDTPLSRRIWASGTGSPEVHVLGNPSRFRAGIPMGRVASADEIAAVCMFLASDESSHITMQEIVVDGGASMIA